MIDSGMNGRTAALISDADLMMYLDGELDGEAAAAVERALEHDDQARNKLEGLSVLGAFLREGANLPGPADDVADAVMGQLSSPSNVVSMDAHRRVEASRIRRIGPLLIAGFAAAALFALWARSRGPALEGDVATIGSPVASVVPAVLREERATEGAEVAEVDFGTNTGSIFYVPGEALANSGTAVIWVNEEPSGDL
jgi:hypothetical protein